ncbi:MAG TPA: hypothetical protein VK480_00115 [Solirubrobacterales bacterium]|nr:hypothetical protein [Solirubrobacterales bacterium]
MDLVQPTLLQTADDRPPPHPEPQQLLPPHHPMLPPGKLLHLPLKKSSGQLSTNTVLN